MTRLAFFGAIYLALLSLCACTEHLASVELGQPRDRRIDAYLNNEIEASPVGLGKVEELCVPSAVEEILVAL